MILGKKAELIANLSDHCCTFCLEEKRKTSNNVNGLSYSGDKDHGKIQKARLGQIIQKVE